MNANKKVVILDTNILTKSPKRNSSEFTALLKLSNSNAILLKVPYLVKMEFVTQEIEKCKRNKESLQKTIKNISKQGFFFDSMILDEETMIEKISEKCNKIEEEFHTWCSGNNIKILELNTRHAELVFNSYFLSMPPFQSLKNRKDIPDAFIFEEIKEIDKKVEDLCFVSNDKNLREFLEKEKVEVYESLESFIKNDDMQEVLLEHLITVEQFQELKYFIVKNETVLESNISNFFLDDLLYKNIKSYQVPSDDNSAIIVQIGTPENIYFNLKNIFYLGDYKVGVPIKFHLDAIIEFAIFKSDYYSYEYDFPVTELNEHYFQAEINKTLLLEALVVLHINIDEIKEIGSEIEVTDTIFEKILDFSTLKIDSIDISDIKSDVTVSSFHCCECERRHLLDCSSLDWQSVDSTERGMGAEVHYQAEYIDSCLCENEMIIIFNCWEYPVGIMNYVDIEPTGVYKIENNCCIDTNERNY